MQTESGQSTNCTITIGRREMRAKFVRWLPGYRCAVQLEGKTGTWTVNGLAVQLDSNATNFGGAQ